MGCFRWKKRNIMFPLLVNPCLAGVKNEKATKGIDEQGILLQLNDVNRRRCLPPLNDRDDCKTWQLRDFCIKDLQVVHFPPTFLSRYNK